MVLYTYLGGYRSPECSRITLQYHGHKATSALGNYLPFKFSKSTLSTEAPNDDVVEKGFTVGRTETDMAGGVV